MERKPLTPFDLLQTSNSYWSSCAIHAGVKLDLFTPLAACPHTVRDLAPLVGADRRGLAMLLNALTALGLLDKTGDTYECNPYSAEYLAKTSPRYLGHIILHHRNLMFSWSHLDEAVMTGRPVRGRYAEESEEQAGENFEKGMANLAMLAAPLVVPLIDLGGCRTLLDLGGGPGTYSVHFCLHNPGLSATVFDLPSTRRFAEDTAFAYGLADRITVLSGDYLRDPLPPGFDAAWLSQILHAEGPEECLMILGKARGSLRPGGKVFVQEFILDDSMDRPLHPALFSLNMLTGTAAGQAYSEGQLLGMLKEAGFRNLRRISLPLQNGAGVIAGMAP